jgi:hypothetical protein
MPFLQSANYYFGGWSTQLIYTEEEMAEACGFTHEQFMEHLLRGQWGLSFHAHPLATGDQYQFNQITYDHNIRIARCIKRGGHRYEVSGLPMWENDYVVRTCRDCGHERYDKE